MFEIEMTKKEKRLQIRKEIQHQILVWKRRRENSQKECSGKDFVMFIVASERPEL
jgi:hypothetical protein